MSADNTSNSILTSDKAEFCRSRSELSEALLRIDGKPVSLLHYPMFKAIYDGGFKNMLLMTCRQIGKSTTLANFQITECLAMPFFKNFFICPSKEQTQKYSTGRVGKTIAYSPLVKKHFVDSGQANRVLNRTFLNGSEMFFSYAEDDADRARGISADRLCYDSRARVLTKTCWKLISEVTLDDEIADVNEVGVVEWNKPTEIIKQRHAGNMIRFKHQGIDLRVTHNHKMWVNWKVKYGKGYPTPDKWEFVEAGELATSKKMGFKMTCGAIWPEEKEKYVYIPGIEHTRHEYRDVLPIPSLPFAELMGWFIAEGSLQYRSKPGGGRTDSEIAHIVISQNENKHAELIEDCIKRTGLDYGIIRKMNAYGNIACTFNVYDKRLGEYCKQFGKCRDKYIPKEIFSNNEMIEKFLYGLYLGDGQYHKGEKWYEGTLRTRSRRLAEDVQRAWVQLRRPSTIHPYLCPPNKESPDEWMYDICSFKREYYIFWKHEREKKQRIRIEENCNEEVYCFTVKNHRPIIQGDFGQKPLISANCIDEVQDVSLPAVLPVVKECLSNSEYAFETYCGTPKTMENSIQRLWETSSQTEWAMKCESCGKHSIVRTEKQFGRLGPICLHCKNYLNPRNGFWVDTNKNPEDVKGFHISRAMMPKNVPAAWREGTPEWEKAKEKWDDVFSKLEGRNAYPLSMFRNEVIGVSDSQGRRLVTIEQLREMQDGPPISMKPTLQNMQGITRVSAGVDWSGGGVGLRSRTVLAILGQIAHSPRYRLLYYKIFPGTSPVDEVNEIANTLQMYNVNDTMVVGVDRGEGNMPSDMLRKRFNNPKKVVKFHYTGSAASNIKWNNEGAFYTLHKTFSIDSLMSALNRGEFQFPKEPADIMARPFEDILNMYEDVTAEGRKYWDHGPDSPDDFLHALNFARITMQIVTGAINLSS